MNHKVEFTPAPEKREPVQFQFQFGKLYEHCTGDKPHHIYRCTQVVGSIRLRNVGAWDIDLEGRKPADWTPLPPGTLTITISEDES